MTLFSSPAPQWTDMKVVAALARRLVPYLDASGFWVLPEGAAPSGAFVADPSGFTIIDSAVITGLKPTLLPNGFVITY